VTADISLNGLRIKEVADLSAVPTAQAGGNLGKIYLYRYITFFNRYHIVLMSTTNAKITINTESPISNQMGFVLRDIKLPIRAPLIDPNITHRAVRNSMLPREQKTIAPATAVKIVAGCGGDGA
jgi:hypothetical protein